MATTLSKDQTARAQYAITELGKQGYSPEQAAGIVGNLLAESGLDPKIVQGGAAWGTPGSGEGLAQWTDAGRQKFLADYASKHGGNPQSFTTQIDAIAEELKTYYPKVNAQLLATHTASQAADVIGSGYEIYGGVNTSAGAANKANREANANAALAAHGGTPSPLDVIEGVIPGGTLIPSAANAAKDALNPLATIEAALTDKSFWIRVAFILAGFIIVLISIGHLTGANTALKDAGETAGKVAA